MKENRNAVRGRRPLRRPAARSNKYGRVAATLAVLAFCALAMVPVGMAVAQHAPDPASGQRLAQAGFRLSASQTVVPQSTPVPEITLAPQATPEPTPEPTPTATPTAAPTATPFAYLPVVHKANTEAKKIAVTVDDCYQTANLREIVGLAEANGGRLTLFPVGENLSKTGMAELLKHCAFDLGFEIENHTYSHARIFRLPEQDMAEEIWKQRAAVNQALGADYRQHFLRLMGGDGDSDQRTHNYLKQLGYFGIAQWSVSGSDSDMAHIQSALAPGQIYLFHTTDADTAKLRAFIPWAVSQGYELVTMNALLGLPENEVAPLSAEEMPAPVSYDDDRHTQKKGDYTWVVVRLQDQLRSQGYLVMDGPSTGFYGDQTAEAVSAFQRAHGLTPTGEADAATQKLLLG